MIDPAIFTDGAHVPIFAVDEDVVLIVRRGCIAFLCLMHHLVGARLFSAEAPQRSRRRLVRALNGFSCLLWYFETSAATRVSDVAAAAVHRTTAASRGCLLDTDSVYELSIGK